MHLLDPNVDPWANRHHLAEEFNNEDNTSTLLRTFDVSPQEAKAALQPIDDQQIYPELEPGLLEAPEVDGDGARFIKRPSIESFHELKEMGGVDEIPRMLLQEAHALQAIQITGQGAPHPNIVPFYGCRVRSGRITGLVLHAYERGLRETVKQGKPVDEQKIVDGLESALRHMHALGWAHNDVNPYNIMVSEAGEPILVDFGSACKIGDKMGASRGTPGWSEEDDDYTLPKASHDLHALDKIRKWLEDPTTTPPPF